MKTAPTGFGYWVAFAGNVTPSPLAQDLEETCRLMKALGAGWIAPRAGMDGWNDGGLTKGALAKYRALGVGVYPWIYTRPKGIASTVVAAQSLIATGNVDGIILDAEAEYLAQPNAATTLADSLRTALGDDVWIAHAPVDNIAFHPSFPWREIVRGTAAVGASPKLDAVLPQLYAWEHNDDGHEKWRAKCEAQWSAWEAKNPDAKVPRQWIGCCYRPKVRGEKAPPPLSLKSVIDDVVAFRRTNPQGSLYCVDAAIALGQRAILSALIKDAGGVDVPDLATVLGRQEALSRLGFYPGPVDGQSGPQTLAATIAFQTSVGLKGDGIVGPKTIAVLEAALTKLG